MLVQTVDVTTTCGPEPSFVCREVLERTNSTFLADLADVLFAKPLSITVVVLVAVAANWVARRAINRLVGVMLGEVQPSRRLKRRLRGTRMGNVLPPSVLDTGSVSLRSAARSATLGNILRSVATFFIWTLAGITILGELGINLGPLIAGAGLAGVALGFGAQSLVKDFLAGIFLIVEDQYGVGDVIDAGEAVGTVEAVTLRQTRLRDVEGTVWHIPNGQIVRVGNMSQQWARALLDVDVAYGSDADDAQSIIKQVADDLWRDNAWAGQVLEEPEMWGIERFGPDGVTLRLVVKTRPARQWAVLRELRSRIKAALDDAGVEIPFPQRTIWVRRDDGAEALPGTEEPAAAELPAPKPAPATRTSGKKQAAKRSSPVKRGPKRS